tara:strand:+ start:2422 stop:3525 length:1104 start_codon:yes stop_codon:yes gene_type:complete
MKRKVQFLTQKNIDKKLLQTVLSNDLKNTKNSVEKSTLNRILESFQKNDFSLLSPQEIEFLNLHPTDVWSKYLVFRHQFLFNPKNRIVSDFPLYLLIEPVSACNLRCIMCFQIDESFSGDKNFMGQMDIELFKKTIDEAQKNGTQAITLASRGEPTLHPKLGEMLHYCSDKFLELKLNTNATRLSEKLCNDILQSGVTDLVFSVDSYQKAEYEKIRVNGIFEKIVENIKRFKDIREQYYPDSTCVTRISGVKVTKEQDPKEFKNFWKDYVDHVVMVEMEPRWDTYHNPPEYVGKGPCDLLWERMYVWYDGTVNVCDADYKSELSPGNINEKSIKEIWKNENYSRLRDLHKNNMRNQCFPCDRCPYGS